MFLSALEKERTGGFQLEIGNIWTKLKIIHHGRAWDWVCDWMSYEDSDSSYSDAAFGGKTLLSFDDKFLTGFVVDLVRDAKAAGLVVKWVDLREKPTSVVGEVPGWLRDYQVDAVAACVGRGRGIVWAPTGSGKCFGKGTPILMYDGHVKRVEDIIPGDALMGPDSKPRTVRSVCAGSEMLWRVVPTKGDPYIVNESHILSLKITGTDRRTACLGGVAYDGGSVVNLTVNQYLAANKTFKHVAKGWRVGVDFETNRDLEIPPYLLGLWLGDGTSRRGDITVCNKNTEVKLAVHDFAKNMGCHIRTEIGRGCETLHFLGNGKGNYFFESLKSLNLLQNKHIPHKYKTASRADRLALLAGIMDTDGHYVRGGFDFVQKSETLFDDVVFLARSLGFAAYKKACVKSCQTGASGTYFRCNIHGDTDQIPTRVSRKKATERGQRKNHALTGIALEKIGVGDYYGFEIDGSDRLFCLGDFTVVHNTVIAAAIMKMVDVRWLFLAHRRELVDQTIAKCRDFAGIECGGYGDGARVTVETYQTMHFRGPLAGIDGLICDEAHTIPASTFAGVCNAQDAAWYRLGLTGTPYGRGDGRSMFVTGLMGPVIYRIRPEGLISSGSLAKPVIKAVECKQEYKMVFHQSQVKRSAEWRKAEKTLITESALRNGMIADLIVGCAKPCIVFVAKRKHGELLLKACERAGVRAEYAHGDTSNAGRTRTLERLAKGDIDVCIGTTIFDEGIDVPNVACVILAGGGKSSIKNIQRIGRGMRVAEGKTSVDIYDICDVGNSTLHEHWKLRRKAFESCGYDVVRVDAA